jgi:ABC-type nickel/cobalt efflux system permease component RcnA
VFMLLVGYSPFMAANLAIAICFVFSFFKRNPHDPKRLPMRPCAQRAEHDHDRHGLRGRGHGGEHRHPYRSGPGHRHSDHQLVRGQLLPALLLIMVTSLVLGMGLPCTPAYIIAITIGGPALLAMGCDLLAAHMFVYYFAILAGITPPVCIPAYCGAAIAEASPCRPDSRPSSWPWWVSWCLMCSCITRPF